MKTGISTACFYPNYKTEDSLDIISDMGFKLCEVFLEAECEMTRDYCSMIKSKADSLGIEIYSVHPFSGGFEPYLFDRYERRKAEMTKKFETVCIACSILGAKNYIFHGLSKMAGRPDSKFVSKNMDELSRIAAGYSVKIAWENVSWCHSSEVDFLKEVTDNMKEEIYFNLDVKQALRGGRSPYDYIDLFKDRMVNIHISDSDSNNFCLLPGEGDYNLRKLINYVRNINENVPYIIEVYSDNFDSFKKVKESKKYIEGLF